MYQACHVLSVVQYITGPPLRARGRGFPLATTNVVPLPLSLEKKKTEPKEIPSCLIPHLLVVFTWQLETLVTTLYLYFL